MVNDVQAEQAAILQPLEIIFDVFAALAERTLGLSFFIDGRGRWWRRRLGFGILQPAQESSFDKDNVLHAVEHRPASGRRIQLRLRLRNSSRGGMELRPAVRESFYYFGDCLRGWLRGHIY